MSAPRVAIVGSSGFVGSRILAALPAGADVTVVSAPRLATAARSSADLGLDAGRRRAVVAELREKVTGASVVVNAAGISRAAGGRGARDLDELFGANALLPVLIARAAQAEGAGRYVHVSSAAVQGDIETLDESWDVAPFSPYAHSKALAETALRTQRDVAGLVVFRPTSVHGSDRAVTVTLARLARSPVSSVIGDGSSPAPHVLADNVGSAIAFVAMRDGRVPPVVMQPWEGLTTSGILSILGGREPVHLPRMPTRALLALLKDMEPAVPHAAPHRRRLQMLWLGQRQAPAWLSSVGWKPVRGLDAWRDLASRLAAGARGATVAKTGSPW